ncbi:hypothetical protein [Runella slithyformis]|uniref:T9SS type A sorting domain-containing protein n=1 Tax=Runella slithyformis (strain ATCC 29530 / DSM 19594 / LMG 11500 / NCIMB 11436 / LSU 4) TaxID=761193 RepID=A0A7U3ZRU8_RUNSL|nr:hypothetical protein [Runella slithyformis]AEI52219.1 hypothetical protein Runsl_5812 [Runella slithyformis DSM 19594]
MQITPSFRCPQDLSVASKLWVGIEKPADQGVELTIFDDRQRIVFHQYHTKGNAMLVQRFDIKNLYDGEYALYIRSGKEIVKKIFTVKTSEMTQVVLK